MRIFNLSIRIILFMTLTPILYVSVSKGVSNPPPVSSPPISPTPPFSNDLTLEKRSKDVSSPINSPLSRPMSSPSSSPLSRPTSSPNGEGASSPEAGMDLFAQIRGLKESHQYEKAMEMIESQNLSYLDQDFREVLFTLKTIILWEIQSLNRNSPNLSRFHPVTPKTVEDSFQSLLMLKGKLQINALVLLSEWLIFQKRYLEAQSHLQKALLMHPNSYLKLQIHKHLANIAEERKDVDQEIQHWNFLEKGWKRKKDYPLAVYNLAKLESKRGSNIRFCKWFKILVTEHPDFESIQNVALFQKPLEFEGRRATCEFRFDDYKRRIRRLEWTGLHDQVRSELDQIRTLYPDNKYELDQLEAQYDIYKGETLQALDKLKKYWDEKSQDPEYLAALGVLYSKSGDYENSAAMYLESSLKAKTFKKKQFYLFQSAFTQYQNQKFDVSKKQFETYLSQARAKNMKKTMIQEVQWYLYWIEYIQGHYDLAQKGFESLQSPSQIKVNYWLAMSLLRKKEIQKSNEIFEGIIKLNPHSYYAILSSIRLKKNKPSNQNDNLNGQNEPQDGKRTPSSEESLSGDEDSIITEDGLRNPLWKEPESAKVLSELKWSSFIKEIEYVRLLIWSGLREEARWELFEVEKKTRNPQALMLLIKEYESVGFFNRSSQLSWELFPQDRWMKGLDDEDGKSYWRSTYPNVYEKEVIQNSSDFQIPPSWIWAIMRAESNYNKDVVSPAGALGLMQVMPQTGMKLAKLLKNDQFLPQQLLLPEIAIKIGTRYLQKLSKDYPQNLALVAAGYNAGPHRVNLWTYLFGALDLDEFVERIPFLETRNYVKKVIANQVIYSQLYKSSTKEDLSYLCEPLKVRWKEAPPNKELWD